MNLRAVAVVIASVCVLLAPGCGENKLGEECEEAGATDGECDSNGVCGKDGAGKLICLRSCTAQTQCAAGEDCNGVEGSNLKGCRPRAK